MKNKIWLIKRKDVLHTGSTKETVFGIYKFKDTKKLFEGLKTYMEKNNRVYIELYCLRKQILIQSRSFSSILNYVGKNVS